MAKDRCEFDNLYKWDTTAIYKDDAECEKDIKSLELEINEYDKFKEKILENANKLLELLDLDSKISRKIEKVYIYAHINNDADTTNTNYQELFGKARNMYTAYLEKTSFIV